MVRWVPHRPAAFLVADAKGHLLLFDLVEKPLAPMAVERLSTVARLSRQALDVCRPSPAAGREASLHLVVASGGPVGPYVRKLGRRTSSRKSGTATEADEEDLLRRSFDLFPSRSSLDQFLLAMPGGSGVGVGLGLGDRGPFK
jgi:hypothetical protein